MATTSERREVARKLRELTVCDGVDAFDIAKALRLEAVSRTEYDTESVRRLADLIDPQERTCRCEQDYECDEPVQGIWWTCNACESRFAYERGFRPRYCPECGAEPAALKAPTVVSE